MNYSSAIAYIENLPRFPQAVGLGNVASLLHAFGSPEKRMKYVHVTGTNGKGSTCAMTASILKESGYTTGLFTSPHIEKYNERIQVNGTAIGDDDFARLITEVKKIVDELMVKDLSMTPCRFEILFVVAILYFVEKKVEIAVVEVGLGGRGDPTNVILSEVSIITNIDLEHQHILGVTKEAIAHEKAGIIKANSICVTTETDKKVLDVIASEAKNVQAKLIVLEPTDSELINQNLRGSVFNFLDMNNVELPLIGLHQISNAMLAITTAQLLKKGGWGKINELTIREGLRKTKWPLRMELVHRKPDFIIDGAHTPDAMRKVVDSLNMILPKDTKRIFILGFTEGKNYEEMLRILVASYIRENDHVIVTEGKHSPVAAKKIVDILENAGIGTEIITSVGESVKRVFKIAKKDESILCFGLYLCAEARTEFIKLSNA